jgi:hypothetical protein
LLLVTWSFIYSVAKQASLFTENALKLIKLCLSFDFFGKENYSIEHLGTANDDSPEDVGAIAVSR